MADWGRRHGLVLLEVAKASFASRLRLLFHGGEGGKAAALDVGGPIGVFSSSWNALSSSSRAATARGFSGTSVVERAFNTGRGGILPVPRIVEVDVCPLAGDLDLADISDKRDCPPAWEIRED